MIFGAMNNPFRESVIAEIETIAQSGFDFVDLTLEYPYAYPDNVNIPQVQSILQEKKLKVVVHSPYYLPFNSPIASLRKPAIEEMKKLVDCANALNTQYCNIHFTQPIYKFPYELVLNNYTEAMEILIPYAASRNVLLVIENTPCKGRDQFETLTKLLDRFPTLGLHLDVAHAFIEGGLKQIQDYLRKHGQRIQHIHLSENNGNEDQHLPLGHYKENPMDWPKIFQYIQESHYNATITLEIFQHGIDGLRRSLAKAKELASKLEQNEPAKTDNR